MDNSCNDKGVFYSETSRVVRVVWP